EYGGRISSVLNVRGKEGDTKKVKGSLGLGLITSRFHMEGPLGKGKTTFVIGGRTTYSDWILGQLPKSNNYADGKADFSDVNLGITHRVDSLNTIQLFGYFSRDKFSFNQDTTFRYNNLNAALRWRHKGSGNTSFVASAGYDRYSNELENYEILTEAYRLNTDIHQVFGRLKFETFAGNHTLSYGAEVVGFGLQGGHMTPFDENSFVLDRQLRTEYAIQPSAYLGDTWRIDEKISLEYGGRLSSFLAMDPAKFYFGPEFRMSAKYSFTPNLSVKAGANTLRQYIHLISNTSSISPMDTWKLCDADIKPVTGWQGAGGIYWTVFDGKLDLSTEAYWKNTWNYLDYKSGALLVMNENLADDLVRTKGKAYGVEFMARKSVGKLNGWLSYTYSRTFLKEMEDRGSNTINGGDWYKTAFDKPHDFKMVANYALTARFSLSANVDYSTGRPVTVPVGWFKYGGGYRLAYSERNGYRVPDYFRLDLALNIDPGHYLKKLTHMSVTLGCYNVTGRKNAYSVFYTTSGGRNIQGYKVSVFATQVPYINLNLLF
ncbi:MAG: TonB-dependent receptor, partial [Bacteroidales bacterium]|nr:TonB-dependent receptor [Bacteroidales bacterium]